MSTTNEKQRVSLRVATTNPYFKEIELVEKRGERETVYRLPTSIPAISDIKPLGAWGLLMNGEEVVGAVNITDKRVEELPVGFKVAGIHDEVLELENEEGHTLLFMANGKMVELPHDSEVVYEQGKGYAVYSPSGHVDYYDGKGKVFSDLGFVGHFKVGKREVDIVKASFDGTTIRLELRDKPHTLQLSRDESRAMLKEAENKGYFKLPRGMELKTSALGIGR